MFVCLGIDESTNNCRILDTEDGVEDLLTYVRVKSLLNAGVTIIGLTSESLELGIRSRVTLQFKKGIFGSTKKEYDGYLFKDVSDDKKDYVLSQIIEFNDLDLYDVCTFDRFLSVLNYIRNINIGLYPKLSIPDKIRVDYVFVTMYSNGLDFQVEEVGTTCVYDFNIFDALYFLVVENEVISNVSYISYDEIHVDDKVLTSKSYMSYVYSNCILKHPSSKKLKLEMFNFNVSMLDTAVKEIKSEINLPLSQLSAGRKELSELLGNNTYRLTLTSYIPIYSIYNSINEVKDVDFNKTPTFNLVDSINYFDKKSKLINVNKNTNVDLNFYIKHRFELKEYNQGVFEEVLKEYKAISALMKFKDKYYEVDSSYDKSLYCGINEKVSAPPLDSYGASYCSWNVTTPYGKIEVQPANYFRSKEDKEIAKVKGFGGIFLCRLTHVGSYWLTFKDMDLSIGTMRGSSDDKVLCNDKFEVLMCNACKNGLAYHDSTICPVGIKSISVDGNGVNIELVCITKKAEMYEKGYTEWGTFCVGVFVVPLVFTGCKCEKIDNYFRIYTLCNTITIERSVFDNLYGTYSSGSFFSNFDVRKKKGLSESKVNKILDVNIESVGSVLKLVDK